MKNLIYDAAIALGKCGAAAVRGVVRFLRFAGEAEMAWRRLRAGAK